MRRECRVVFRSSLLLLAGLLWLCLGPAVVFGALRLEAPAEAPQGSVVAIRVYSDEAVESVRLTWLDINVPVPMSLPDKQGMRSGRALLPMPLEGTKTLGLQAAVGRSSAKVDIRPRKVAWPRQEIKVEGKYVAPPPEVQKRIADEQRKNKAVLERIDSGQYWTAPFVWPVPGAVSSVFGGQRVFNGEPRSRHRGTDLRAAVGEPVLAMTGGKVAIAAEQYFSGNVVFVDHGQGVVSIYAHLSALQVAEGETVRPGQQLGLAGATGRVTGPHLHWGVNILGKPVDPLSLMPAKGGS